MKGLRIFFISILTVFLSAIVVGATYYFAVTKDAVLHDEKLLLSDVNICIYDENGEPVKNACAQNMPSAVHVSDLQKHTVFAFVDTEDKRFFSHNGFDFKRMVKAALTNLKAGSFKQGASTISQQLIKNTHLTQEKTLKRKLNEIKLTRQLEKRFSKTDILGKYLNTIYFGHNCFGIESAAAFYFGKNAAQLTLGESAILAGLVKSPNNYSPFKNPEKSTARKNVVLSLMKKQGHATDAEIRAAKNEPLPEKPFYSKQNATYFRSVFDEFERLADEFAFTANGKIEIYTYLDCELQKRLDGIMQNATTEKIDKRAVVLDAKTHGFKAYYATIDDVKRSPGSTVKPLAVYAPAIEKNLLSPVTPILDEKTNFNGYSPENYGGKYNGYVSAREALSQSLNVPAVKTLNSLGIENAVYYLKKLGLSVEKDDEALTLALGGMKNGFTLKELVTAYAIFANDGAFAPASFIKEIRINDRQVYKKIEKKTRVFGADTAYLTTDMLKTAAKNGTAKKLRELAFDIAAKTGTAGTKEKNTDAYTISYTTRDVIGVWLGNADNLAIEHTGGGLPCSISLKLHRAASEIYDGKNITITPFEKPKNVKSVSLDKTEYSTTRSIVLADERAPMQYVFNELFKKSAIPTKKADKFTNPRINVPTVHVDNNNVEIVFSNDSPPYYDYKIVRYSYDTHITIYDGKLTNSVFDKNLPKGVYRYAVIPIFDGNAGKPVYLPQIKITGESALSPIEPPEITKKDWWAY